MQLKQVPQLITSVPRIAETIARHVNMCTSMVELKRIHAQIIRNELHCENYLAVKLVSLCGQAFSNIKYARLIFDGAVDTANVFLWTAMITAYCKHQSPVTIEAIFVYRKMHQLGIQPNSFTLSSVLKACSFLLASQEGEQIHAHTVKLGVNSDIYVQTTLLDMYAKFGCLEVARNLFDEIPEKNIVAWNAMIVAYTKSGSLQAARDLFDRMPQRDSISWTAMMSGYSNHGNMQAAWEVFDKMHQRDITSWNVLLTGYAHRGEWQEALKLFYQMESENVRPNQVTMAIVISVCGQLGALVKARQIHEDLKKNRVEINSHVSNSLIDMYAKCGSLEEAYTVFRELPNKDTISYNAMIVGLANHGLGHDALKLFSELLRDGELRPDRVTLIGVLTACSHAGLVDEGRQHFDCMNTDYEIDPSVDHYACMVDLLGRAGFIEEAYELVKKMKVEPHAGVWGALLGASKTYHNVEIGEIAARQLFELEPDNPGNYVILSNIYAGAERWDDVARMRGLMRGKGVAKTAGCSWIELDNGVHKFLIGDTSHPQWRLIYAILDHLSLQLILDGYVMDSDNLVA